MAAGIKDAERRRRGRARVAATTIVASAVVAVSSSPSVAVRGEFAPAESLPTGPDASAVAVADIDLDGTPDIVTVSPDSGSVTVHLSGGRSDYTSRDYAMGDSPRAVVLDDFNGDRRLDMAVVDRRDSGLIVRLNQSLGVFGPATKWTTGVSPVDLDSGDVNGDGVPDVVVADQGANEVTLRLGAGDGTFAPVTTAFPAGGGSGGEPGGPTAVVLEDLDGDGALDLLVASMASDGVRVFRGNGDGDFVTPQDYSVGADPLAIAVGDFDGDDTPDLATANVSDGTVSVRLGLGDGSFAERSEFSVGAILTDLVGADLNGDGKADLAVTDQDADVASVFLSHGDGTFGERRDHAVGNGPRAVAVGDLDRDQDPDLVVANEFDHTVSLLHGAPAPKIAVVPGAVDFGPLLVGAETTEEEILVANTGEAPLAMGEVSLAGDHVPSYQVASDTCTGTRVAPGTSCKVSVRFAPDEGGARTAQLRLPHGAVGSPAVVDLAGVGDRAPVAVDDELTVSQDSAPIEIDVLDNDTDADGGPISLQSVSQPTHGAVALTGDRSAVSYEPEPGYCNSGGGQTPDEFDYALNGGSTATVSVTVTCPVVGGNALADLLAGIQAAIQGLLGGLFGGLG